MKITLDNGVERDITTVDELFWLHFGTELLSSGAYLDARDELRNYFPADDSCYGCRGTGEINGFGLRGVRCSCTTHESGECEPEMCSPMCVRKAELRGDR